MFSPCATPSSRDRSCGGILFLDLEFLSFDIIYHVDSRPIKPFFKYICAGDVVFFLHCVTSSSRPHWDGHRILFEIMDARAPTRCAISRAALDEIGEERCLTAADLLACFHVHRLRIEAIALTKARARPAGGSGRLNLWARDMNGPPPGDVPHACRPEALRMSA